MAGVSTKLGGTGNAHIRSSVVNDRRASAHGDTAGSILQRYRPQIGQGLTTIDLEGVECSALGCKIKGIGCGVVDNGTADIAIEIAKDYENAYLDLCDTGRFNGIIEKMVSAVGAEKVLYATDAPMQGYRFIQGAVLAADITDAEKKLIFRDNALRLLNMEDK